MIPKSGNRFSERSCSLKKCVSAAGRALRVDVERIERVACRHEQAVPPHPAEAEVGGALRQVDLADALAVGVEHDHAVVALAHAPAAPQIAVDVAAEAVRR